MEKEDSSHGDRKPGSRSGVTVNEREQLGGVEGGHRWPSQVMCSSKKLVGEEEELLRPHFPPLQLQGPGGRTTRRASEEKVRA